MIAPGRTAAVVAALVVVGSLAGSARADSFGGFSANEKRYLVGANRVCTPVVVDANGAAPGSPSCATAPANEVAALSARLPSAERGAKARILASARARIITVVDAAADSASLVAWASPDPVVRIVDVWQSATERLIAVEFVARRGNRELTDVVVFDRGVGRTTPTPPTPTPPTPTPPAPSPAVADPDLARVVTAARKAKGKTAIKGWNIVLSMDADHPEALFRLAAIDAAGKRTDAALGRLEALAASKDPGAIEWLIDARFDKAFAKLVGEPRFRAAVGFDRPAASTYERVMGFGGQWEQGLVPCDRPEMKLTFRRDRSFSLVLRLSCQGMRDKVTYRGTWAVAGDAVALKLPKLDTGDDIAPCQLTTDRDEDVLRCQVDDDLSFEARPTRR